MNNVVRLSPPGPTEGLRNIADQIDRGEIPCDRVTLVIGSELYHLGTQDDREAAQAAVFDLNTGLSKMMLAAHGVL